MTVIESVHRDLGATFRTVDGVRVPEQYGRPERAHLATRNGVGLVEAPYAVLVVDGDRAGETLSPHLSVPVPETDGRVAQGRLLDDAVRGEATVLVADDRLLCLVSPGARSWLLDRAPGARDATGEFGVFGLHGPQATEKLAGVLHGAGAPERRLSFVRGRTDGSGVTVLRTDAPAGEEGFEVVCAAADARGVHDSLLVRGPNSTPVGHRTWGTLTLEAGTPLPTDLVDLPASVLREIVPDASPDAPRVVGLAVDDVPDADDPVTADGRRVGRVLRAVDSPSLDRPIALATVESGVVARDGGAPGLTVETDSNGDGNGDGDSDRDTLSATVRSLPFVEGSATSGRILPS